MWREAELVLLSTSLVGVSGVTVAIVWLIHRVGDVQVRLIQELRADYTISSILYRQELGIGRLYSDFQHELSSIPNNDRFVLIRLECERDYKRAKAELIAESTAKLQAIDEKLRGDFPGLVQQLVENWSEMFPSAGFVDLADFS